MQYTYLPSRQLCLTLQPSRFTRDRGETSSRDIMGCNEPGIYALLLLPYFPLSGLFDGSWTSVETLPSKSSKGGTPRLTCTGIMGAIQSIVKSHS
jgi:hypothetical protein